MVDIHLATRPCFEMFFLLTYHLPEVMHRHMGGGVRRIIDECHVYIVIRDKHVRYSTGVMNNELLCVGVWYNLNSRKRLGPLTLITYLP